MIRLGGESVALLVTWRLLVEIVQCVSEVKTNAVLRNINQISFVGLRIGS